MYKYIGNNNYIILILYILHFFDKITNGYYNN